MGKKHWYLRMLQDISRDTAQNELSKSGMTVDTHDNEVLIRATRMHQKPIGNGQIILGNRFGLNMNAMAQKR